MNNLMPLSRICQLARNPKKFGSALFSRVMSQQGLREVLYCYNDWRDYVKQRTHGVPPASLRFRVHGDVDVRSFLETGNRCGQDINEALVRARTDMSSFRNILDFGCGCRRTIIWLDASR